ncbi:MAG: hypothetical protein A4E54_01918 [Pelotomaculum sp. PtaB.Bin117]|nr:MAG: hypothetical protein A4E54_01918 [Pelotomaculum sp. PtaB.Bin117]
MKRNKAFKMLCRRWYEPFFPVCKGFNPVQHSDCDPAAAYRAYASRCFCIRRLPAHLACPVPVIVVFAFLREKLHRAVKFLCAAAF